ncbi:MAG: alpha/beta hydrolase-fold protein [Chloroflexota bacterium]
MSRFGKIELSDPQYESGQLRFLTFNSPALQGRGDTTLFIPLDSSRMTDVPLVILLHGVYCSHWSWAFKGGAHLTAAEMIANREIPPMVLAMPSDGLWGEGSGYLPHKEADYEAWIVKDVIECITGVLTQVGERSAVFIAGLSMGGYGALRLGAKYPEYFKGISAHSAITQAADLPRFIKKRPLSFDHKDEALEITYWLYKNRTKLPPIRFDCGLDDGLLGANQHLHKQLCDSGIPHQYQEFSGKHKWSYWTRHLRDTLRFFGEIAQALE